MRGRALLVLFDRYPGAQGSLLGVSSGGDPLRLAPHGHDHRGSYWRTAGRLPAQQEDPVHYKRPEDHELWRYIRVNNKGNVRHHSAGLDLVM